MDFLWKLITEWPFTTFLIALFIFYTAHWYLSIPSRIPPGPRGLPLLGYLPFLVKEPYETYLRLGEKYGSIYSLFLGNRLVVVLNDFQVIQEAFVKKGDIFSGRPEEARRLFSRDVDKNVVTMDGNFWQEHRKFAMALMRDCGVGKSSIELRITDEIHCFLNEIQKTEGKMFDIRDTVSMSVANNISIVVTGKRYDYDDPSFLDFLHKIDVSARLIGPLTVLSFLPWLKYAPGIKRLFQCDLLRKTDAAIANFTKEIVLQHKINYSDGQRDDYINAYITEQRARHQQLKQDETFSDDALVNNARTLQEAGIETTSNTLLWAITFMMQYPEVQKNVQDELDKVIGTDRTPSWNDRLRTPYTEATICEIQRMANLVPINLPHSNLVECELRGYKIPSNTCIIALLGNILNDPKLWNDPQNFQPERFLNNKGEVERPPYFMPFSIGKRQCLGETLAKMELYLYFTSMLQKFTFVQPNEELPSLECDVGITRIPKNTETRAILRQ